MGTIPFKDRKFRKVEFASLTLSKTFAHLEYSFIPCGEEPFHAKLRRGMEIHGGRFNSVNMEFRCGCRDQNRSLNFHVAPPHKKIPDGLHHQGSYPEILSAMRQ